MGFIPLTTPYSIKSASFTVVADDYASAISQVQFDPTSSPTKFTAINGNIVKDASVPDWMCTLSHAQDLATGSLTRYLLANSGLTKAVTFVPVAGGPASHRRAPRAVSRIESRVPSHNPASKFVNSRECVRTLADARGQCAKHC